MDEKDQVHPTNRVNFFSKVTLWWIVDLLRQGNLKPLQHDDLYPIRREEQAEYHTKRLEEIWKNEMKSARFKQQKPRVWKAMLKYFSWKEYFFLFSLAAVSISGAMLNWYCVIHLSIVIGSNFKEMSIPRSDYLVYVYGVLLGYIFETIAANRYNRYTSILAIRARAGILGLIYKKVLGRSKSSIDPGQVMELVCNDTQRCVMSSDLFIPYGFLRASQGILFTGWLFLLIGWKMTPGIIVVVLLAMFRFFIAFVDIDLRRTASKFAETRLRYLREVLTIIYSVKLNCLEDIYQDKIYQIRWKEIKKKAKRLVIMSLNFSSSICGQHLVTLVTVIVLVITDPSSLTFEIIFPVTFLISYIIKIFCLCIPTTVHFSTDILTALARVENFLRTENFEFEMINKCDTDSELLKKDSRGDVLLKRTPPFLNLQNVSCSPPQTDPRSESKQTSELLKNVSLNIQDPGLVVVCGAVGSGKSLLLTSIIKGELSITQGSVDYSGSLAYVSDTPWVFPGTVRENVLFGLPFDEEWYLKTVEACQLEKDFKNFPQQDLSQIGEHGATLSGGQRTRIALARAVYSRANIYLLDDPLSSLDSKVAEYIFKCCLKGLLTSQIVLLTTHTCRYLREADYVVKMDSGRIALQGRFQDIKRELLEIELGKEGQTAYTKDDNAAKDKKETIESIDEVKGDQLQVVEEDRETGNVSFKIYWNFFINGATAVLLLVILLIVFIGQGLVVLLHVLVSSLPHVLEKEGIICSFLIFYVILFSLTVFMIIIGELCTLLLPLRASYNIHNKMVSAILKAPTWFFAVNPVGRILNRFSQDLYNLDELLPFNLTYVIYTAAPAVGALVLCSISQIYLIPVAIAGVLGAFFLARFFFGSAMDIKRLMQIGGGPLYSHFSNTMEGLRIIRVHNREQKFINILFRHADHHHEAMFVYFTAARWFGIMMDFVFLAFTVVVIIIEIYSDRDSSTAVIAAVAIMYSYNTIRNAQTGIRLAAEANSQMTSAERTLAYTEIEPEKGRNVEKQPPRDWPSNGEITFNNVSLCYYKNGPSVLKNLRLKIKSCEKIGIAGRTGAGKSSFVAAIMRIAETGGQILIDGINIENFNTLFTRRCISVISQIPVLFNGTIRENLDPSTKIPDHEIWNALDQLEISSLIHDLPGKLDCKISGSGSNFSVGQRQLLHIARVLLKKNKVVIFDEATGKIDKKTDQQIQEIVRKIFKDCTVITISHRLSTIMDCDRILVLDQGVVVEFDEPRVLLRKEDGLLRELFELHS